MSKTLQQISEYLDAELRLASTENSADTIQVVSLAPLDQAKQGAITFLSDTKYLSQLDQCQATAIILTAEVADQFADKALASHVLIMPNPYLGFAKLSHLFNPAPKPVAGVHPSAVIGDNVSLGQNVSVGPNAVIEANCDIADDVIIGANSTIGAECKIGKGTRIYPRVTLYHGVTVGELVTIQSGAVIGSDGFGFANEKGEWHKIAQIGGVRIGSRVEIGANTTIDRGAIDDTVIEDNVILDNQIQIAHNVKIGYGSAMAGCSGVAGSTEIGKYCIVGGGSCISGHLKIADGTQFTGMSSVTGNIKQAGTYSSGTGVQETAQWRKSVVRFRQLDDMARKIKALEKQITQLDQKEQD